MYDKDFTIVIWSVREFYSNIYIRSFQRKGTLASCRKNAIITFDITTTTTTTTITTTITTTTTTTTTTITTTASTLGH